MKLVAIIPARGGSKGIPNKNIVDICGLPMIAYTIKSALNSNIFHQVAVTTDNQDIKNTSLSYGACVIDRPSELAADNSSCLDAIEHALKYIISQDSSFTHFILLQPTSPLRNENHIIEAFKVYKSKNIGSLVSVNLNTTAPQKNLVEINGKIEPITTINDLTQNRQNLPKTYHPNGAIYISKIDDFLRDKNLFSDPLSIYVMDEESSTDVDNYDDLEKVKNILTNLNNQKDQFTSLISLINKPLIPLISKINSKAYDKALEFYKTEDFTKAIDILSSLDRLSFDEISLIGVIYFKLQEFEKSKQFLEYCISQDPKKASKQSWLYYFNIIASQNDLEKCKDIIEQVIKYNKMDIRFAKTVLNLFYESDNLEELSIINTIYPFYEEYCFNNAIKIPQNFSKAHVKYQISLNLAYNKTKIDIPNDILESFEICIPTYQRKDILISTLKEMKEVNEKIHIRVLDNASTDGSFEELEKLAQQYPNLHILKNEKNMGYAYSMIRLLENSEKKYVIFTSNEEPVIIDNISQIIKDCISQDIGIVSPVFFKFGRQCRGYNFNRDIPLNDFGRCCADFPGIIINAHLVKKLLHTIKNYNYRAYDEMYPIVYLSIIALVFGTGKYHKLPSVYVKYKTENQNVKSKPTYNLPDARWVQTRTWMSVFDDLQKNTLTSKNKINEIENTKTFMMKNIINILKNAARREFPQYKEYFI
ncbi:glycosyltransferase [Campylobacter lanienae]|uniref:Glycosyltransferase n=1 Tax=Campylobacter lanienae TaxID=75658 RepID=A0ABY3G5V1_9BACT|nr:glycosyltransferase [Campylobacter lanienae]TWO27697.1 glycosyltransferase [Campylobacter lanienae]